ncbi:LytR/AlgR family response regulator transcription factor [Mucilaginibacter calamicampi]|uniref:LytR/AlgR family response regulator transcription factor n=1 Tax=Mucilaginibacter calamicampi TaxID=1302352 RepID=A0ABW2YTQ3_9SPHI
MIFKTLIIDDEQLARQRLIRLLGHFNEIKIIGEAANGQEALRLIEAQKPDLIFLDVEMPVLNGFEMLAKLSAPPKVVFTTAYDHYALKAFEEGSIDYLLKPVEKDRLQKTVERLAAQFTQQQNLPIAALLQQLQPKTAVKNLTVKIGDRILLIRPSDIIYAEAEDKYFFIYTSEGKKHLTDYTITGLQSKLDDQFLQISRSMIINTDQIKEIRKGFNGTKVFVMNHTEAKLGSGRSFNDMINERFGL